MPGAGRVLDLGCGAGGCSVGYARAGFEVVGVDLDPQPNYPFEFIQGDMMTVDLSGFDLIHASPPCQRWSRMDGIDQNSGAHPDLIAPMRARLAGTGKPWVIENIPSAPLVMRDSVLLCGSMFDLGVWRHRLFETPVPIFTGMWCDHSFKPVGVYGSTGGSSNRRNERYGTVHDWREAMDIDWMLARELREAIPPAYTKWVGESIAEALRWP